MTKTLAERVGTLEGSHSASDPDLANAFRSEATPTAVAPTTGGPQRLTFLVPSEKTVVSFGQEVAPRGETAFNGVDTGLGGQTTNHIDFQATAAPATTVTIGTPVTANVGFSADAVPKGVHGYGMATADIAYHQASLQHYCVSTHGDVIVRAQSAKPAVLNAPGGGATVECNAGGDISITGNGGVHICAGSYASATPGRAQAWVTSGYANGGGMALQAAGIGAGVVSGMMGAIAGLMPTVKRTPSYAPGSSTEPTPQSNLADALALCSSGVMAAPVGVAIHGASNAVACAGVNAGMWANASVSVVGGLVAGLFGATADLKGFLVSGIVAGVEASLAALGKVAVKATDLISSSSGGTTQVASLKDVSIEGKFAHLSSDDAAALYSHSKHTLVLSTAYGMVASSKNVKMGTFSSTSQLGGASFQSSKPHVQVDDKKTVLVGPNGTAKLTLDKDGAKMKYGGLTVHAKKDKKFKAASGGKFVMLKGV